MVQQYSVLVLMQRVFLSKSIHSNITVAVAAVNKAINNRYLETAWNESRNGMKLIRIFVLVRL